MALPSTILVIEGDRMVLGRIQGFKPKITPSELIQHQSFYKDNVKLFGNTAQNAKQIRF